MTDLNYMDDQVTTWLNNSNETVTFLLHGDEQRGVSRSGKPTTKVTSRRVTIKPNACVTLQSKYDQAIRREKNGKVVGGLCPWLVKVGESTPLPMDACLDYKAVAEDLAVKELAKKINEERALEEALSYRKGQKKAEKASKPVKE